MAQLPKGGLVRAMINQYMGVAPSTLTTVSNWIIFSRCKQNIFPSTICDVNISGQMIIFHQPIDFPEIRELPLLNHHLGENRSCGVVII